MTRFIQIHWLTSYPATLLNRDDAGLAKRMPFGGVPRARVSSQCLKRRWRTADDVHSLANVGVPMGSRSKKTVEMLILPEAEAADASVAHRSVLKVFVEQLYSDKDSAKRQALFFGKPEIDYLREKALACLDAPEPAKAAEAFFKEERANLRVLKHGAGLESALFGRMMTSDPSANTDAAIHVAHALSVHRIERDLDYLTAVDDLDEGTGAAGLFDVELTSALYYGYVVVDVPLLIANLANDALTAGKVIEHLIHLIAEVSPGAKKGSTAPYARAEVLLVEVGDRQPRTLANAFRNPIALGSNRLFEDSVEKMAAYLGKLDTSYNTGEARRAVNLSDTPLPNTQSADLATIATWVSQQIAAAEPSQRGAA
jgi:CRISPR system Cascade subunit CasC